jgi:hypothetical protein
MISPEARAQLSAWLAEEAGAGSVRLENIAQLSGGAISENIAIDLIVEVAGLPAIRNAWCGPHRRQALRRGHAGNRG